jgi:hypothetical protein
MRARDHTLVAAVMAGRGAAFTRNSHATRAAV